MRAIFLDIDGVVATPTSMRLNYLLGRSVDTQWYDCLALRHVGDLVRKTGARVVLSSTWREDLDSPDPFMRSIMQNLLDQLAEVGAPVAGGTPVMHGHDRSAEIGSWLDANPCEAWVIFDDMARFDERPEVADGHLVLVEDSEGIRARHYQAALRILEGGPRC